jgi:hypothetical protein
MSGVWNTGVADSFGRLLASAAVKSPMEFGSVIEFVSVMGEEPNGKAVAVVLRAGPEPRSYWVKPLAAEDMYYRWHLLERDSASGNVLIQVANRKSDFKKVKISGLELEVVESFRALSFGTEPDNLTMAEWLSEGELPSLEKKVNFVRDMLAAEACEPSKVKRTPLLYHNKRECAC